MLCTTVLSSEANEMLLKLIGEISEIGDEHVSMMVPSAHCDSKSISVG